MNDVFRHGRAAWERLKKGSGLWADWILVGHALIDGRKIALRNAGTDRVHGGGYAEAFSSWMIDNRFNVPSSARAKLFTLMENLAAVEAWRATLTDAQRQQFNHPSAVLRNYRKVTAVEPAPGSVNGSPQRMPKSRQISACPPRDDPNRLA